MWHAAPTAVRARVQVVAHAVQVADKTNAELKREINALFDLLQARPEELGPDEAPTTAAERDKARGLLQELLHTQQQRLRAGQGS